MPAAASVARRPLGWVARSCIGVAVAAVVGLGGWAYHPPMIVVRPLAAVDVSRDIVVTGAPVHPVHGRYLLLTVRLERPNGFGAAMALLEHRRRLSLDSGSASATPPGASNSIDAFTHSQQEAAAAAAISAGYDVRLTGTGATVVDPLDHAGPDELFPGDVIVGVEHHPVVTAADVHRLAGVHPAGPLALTVERLGSRTELTLTRTPVEARTATLRAVLETRDARFSLPFTVTFRRRPIGGPSGGLVYALALADMLGGRDLAGGRSIAATGAIDAAGGVIPVGFVTDKSNAVRWARASQLLVPLDELTDAHGTGRPVRGVLTLNEAIRLLSE
jgi:PDZ domain-containing protein